MSIAFQDLPFIILALTAFTGLYKGLVSKGSGIQVSRGKSSWKIFGSAYGLILSAYIFFLTNNDFSNNKRFVLFIFSIIAILYICFESGWFQNKIIGVHSRYISKKRGHS